MLWDRIVETWQSISSKAWISRDGDACDRGRQANLATTESGEVTSDGSSDLEQLSAGLWRRHDDIEQIHTNSLHMSS